MDRHAPFFLRYHDRRWNRCRERLLTWLSKLARFKPLGRLLFCEAFIQHALNFLYEFVKGNRLRGHVGKPLKVSIMPRRPSMIDPVSSVLADLDVGDGAATIHRFQLITGAIGIHRIDGNPLRGNTRAGLKRGGIGHNKKSPVGTLGLR
jgi:hypothetical protein